MAKAKKAGKLTAKPAGTPGGVVVLDENLGADLGDARALIQTLTAGREDAEWNVKVYLVPGGMGRGAGGRQQFLFEVQLEDLPNLEQQLAAEFPGGGIFRVMIRADNILQKNATLDIAPRPGWKPPPPSYLTPVTPPLAAPAAEAPDRLERFFDRLADMIDKGAQQTRELIAAMSSNKEKPPTLLEQLQVFGEIQKLMPKAAQENTQASFEKGMEFAKTIYEAADRSGGAGWLDIMKEALASPAVQELVKAMATAAPAAVAALPQHQPLAAPPSNPFAPPAPQPLQAPRAVSAGNPIARNAIETLIKQAEAGIDAAAVAPQVLNSLPENILEELEQQQDMLSFLEREFPAISQHRQWFAALIAEMYEPEQPIPAAGTMADPNAGLENPPESQS